MLSVLSASHVTCASSAPRRLTASLGFFFFLFLHQPPFSQRLQWSSSPSAPAKTLCHKSPSGEHALSVEGRYCCSFHVRDNHGPKLLLLHQHFWWVNSTPLARLTGRGGGQAAENSSRGSFQTCRQHITKRNEFYRHIWFRSHIFILSAEEKGNFPHNTCPTNEVAICGIQVAAKNFWAF